VTWVRLDDHFADHPKMLSLGAFAPLALALQVRALCYAARHLTDGFIPEAAITVLTDGFGEWSIETGGNEFMSVGADADDFDWPALMLKAGLWHRRKGGYAIHDYLIYNPSRAVTLKERESNAKRQKAFRDRNATNNGPVTGLSQVPPSPSPTPTPESKTKASVATQPAGAARKPHTSDHGSVPRETPFAVLFPLIREHLWRPDGKCPAEINGKPWSEDQEGTVIRELAKSYSVSDLEVIVLGLGSMLRGLAEAERPEWLAVGAKASLRAVFHTRSGVVQMVEHCRRAYWTVENRKPKKSPTSTPSRIGDALPGVVP